MGPKALRNTSKKASSELPETARVNFLTSAAQLVSSSLPQLSTHLGQQALKLADAKQVLLSSVTARNQLCRVCGGPLNPETCDDVYISWLSEGSSRRLSKRLGGMATRQARASGNNSNRQGKPMNRVVAVRKCSVCQQPSVRPFLSVSLAQHQLSKEGFSHVRVQGREQQQQQQAAARKQHRQQLQGQQQQQDTRNQSVQPSSVDHQEMAHTRMHPRQHQLQAATGQHAVTAVAAAAAGGAEVQPAARCSVAPAAAAPEAAEAEPLAAAAEAAEGPSVAGADQTVCDDVNVQLAGEASCDVTPGRTLLHPQVAGPSSLPEQQRLQQMPEQQQQQHQQQVQQVRQHLPGEQQQQQQVQEQTRSTTHLEPHLVLPAAHTPSHTLPCSRRCHDGAALPDVDIAGRAPDAGDDKVGVEEAGLLLQVQLCAEAGGAPSQGGPTAGEAPVTAEADDPKTAAQDPTTGAEDPKAAAFDTKAAAEVGDTKAAAQGSNEEELFALQPHCSTAPHVTNEHPQAQQPLQLLVTEVFTDTGAAAGSEAASTVASASGAPGPATAALNCTELAGSAAALPVEHNLPQPSAATAAAAAQQGVELVKSSAPPPNTVGTASPTAREASAAAAAAAAVHTNSSNAPLTADKGSSQVAEATRSIQGAARVTSARLWPLCPAAFTAGSWSQQLDASPSQHDNTSQQQQQQTMQVGVVMDESHGDIVDRAGEQEAGLVPAASVAPRLIDNNSCGGTANGGSAGAAGGAEAAAAAEAVDTAVDDVEAVPVAPPAVGVSCSEEHGEAAAPPLEVPDTLCSPPPEVPETSAASPGAADVMLSAAAPPDSPFFSRHALHTASTAAGADSPGADSLEADSQVADSPRADSPGPDDVSSSRSPPSGAADSQSLSYHGPWAPHRRRPATAAAAAGTDSQSWSCSVSQGSEGDGSGDGGDWDFDDDLEQDAQPQEVEAKEHLEVIGANTDDVTSDSQEGRQLLAAEQQRNSVRMPKKRGRGVDCTPASAPPPKASRRGASAYKDSQVVESQQQPRSRVRGSLSHSVRTESFIEDMPDMLGQVSTARPQQQQVNKPPPCRGQQGRASQHSAVHQHLMRKNVGRKVLRHWVYRT